MERLPAGDGRVRNRRHSAGDCGDDGRRGWSRGWWRRGQRLTRPRPPAPDSSLVGRLRCSGVRGAVADADWSLLMVPLMSPDDDAADAILERIEPLQWLVYTPSAIVSQRLAVPSSPNGAQSRLRSRNDKRHGAHCSTFVSPSLWPDAANDSITSFYRVLVHVIAFNRFCKRLHLNNTRL